ncbi:hypothetical protein PoB_005989000 [Plakobranchus ocellatus]|uniref:Uncharacterized protein n=1 Tax=Plakobranchus ocellatus TaxID=259542 RepID=A0AAV4CKE2_9GAST|nr:hypothetical protein PoB_005989000 [Plakobranchus ocellatus]
MTDERSVTLEWTGEYAQGFRPSVRPGRRRWGSNPRQKGLCRSQGGLASHCATVAPRTQIFLISQRSSNEILTEQCEVQFNIAANISPSQSASGSVEWSVLCGGSTAHPQQSDLRLSGPHRAMTLMSP